MNNPKVIIPVIIVLFILFIIAGKNWNKMFPSKPAVKPDGTPCTIPASGSNPAQSGFIKKGVCVTSGGVNPNSQAGNVLKNISNGENPLIQRTTVNINPNYSLRACDWLDYYLQAYNSSVFPLKCGPHSGAYRFAPHTVTVYDYNALYNRAMELGANAFTLGNLRKDVQRNAGKIIK